MHRGTSFLGTRWIETVFPGIKIEVTHMDFPFMRLCVRLPGYLDRRSVPYTEVHSNGLGISEAWDNLCRICGGYEY
jgi:hypothetical protein